MNTIIPPAIAGLGPLNVTRLIVRYNRAIMAYVHRLLMLAAGGVLLFAARPMTKGEGQTVPATVAFTNARIIDGTGRAPIEKGTLLVGGDTIEAVGPAATITIPAGAARIDVTGKTIVPGLINAHGHLGWTTARWMRTDALSPARPPR